MLMALSNGNQLFLIFRLFCERIIYTQASILVLNNISLWIYLVACSISDLSPDLDKNFTVDDFLKPSF